jgi:hypothetical protein
LPYTHADPGIHLKLAETPAADKRSVEKLRLKLENAKMIESINLGEKGGGGGIDNGEVNANGDRRKVKCHSGPKSVNIGIHLINKKQFMVRV